jgi:hypothetical protein
VIKKEDVSFLQRNKFYHDAISQGCIFGRYDVSHRIFFPCNTLQTLQFFVFDVVISNGTLLSSKALKDLNNF